ncbi:MAG: radical SAM protein [Deltaproteobacteria bacterium]|nr:radical SAM protein [Deltaproteobacteria bacterium]
MKNSINILIIIPRYNLTNEINYRYAFPLGLSFISAALKQAGFHVDCLNLNHCEGHIKTIINGALSKKAYNYVGTGSNSLLYAVIEKILNTVREHPSRPKIVLGGPIITSEPETIFNALNPDYAVIGEGEKTIVELLECLEQGKNIWEVKGIGYRDKTGKAIFTLRRDAIEDLDALPFPDFEGIGFKEQLDHIYTNTDYVNNVFDNPRVYPLLASRGCPFKCTFCYHYEMYRARSMDNIIDELRLAVKSYGSNIINIFDECFSIKKGRIYEFCERIKKLQKELSCDLKWSCQMTVNSVDKDILEQMKEAGCDSISYGFESYSPVVLRSMHKPVTAEQIDKAFHETLDAGIAVQANFIFGDIAETLETATHTLNYWKEKCKGQVNLDFIQPYPGSEIYNHCLRKGLIKDKLDFIKNHIASGATFNMTEGMTDEEFRQLKKDVFDAESKGREQVRPISIKKVKKTIYSLDVKCPYCKQTVKYNNCFIKNRLTYGFNIICRNCHMRFFIVSFAQKLAYSHYSKIRDMRVFQKNMIKRIKKKLQ